jgi:hypothetical protein
MLRNVMIASAVMLAAAAFAPAGALAGGGQHHRHGHHHQHLRPFHGHVFGHHHHVRCWRWALTRFGYRRVRVCG